MSPGVSLCLILILYGNSWTSFFKILCEETKKNQTKSILKKISCYLDPQKMKKLLISLILFIKKNTGIINS